MARQLKANAGAKLRAQILSYDHAKTFYEAHGGARKGNRAPLAHNTVVAERGTDVRGAPAYAIQLHRTDIVTFMPDGGIVLDNGGYQTVTTKARMNEILHPLGVSIDQSRFEWYVREIGSSAKPIPYFNGMEIRVERPAVWTGEKWESHVTLPGETRNNPRLGKFEGSGDFGEAVHELVMDSSYLDEEIGSADELGWYGLATDLEVPGFSGKRNLIASESDQGFFDVDEYDTPEQARKAWKRIERAYEKFYAENGDDA